MARGTQPAAGDTVVLLNGDEPAIEATVRDLLSEQFTATHEVQRSDGGWREITSFRFYRDHGDTWQ